MKRFYCANAKRTSERVTELIGTCKYCAVLHTITINFPTKSYVQYLRHFNAAMPRNSSQQPHLVPSRIHLSLLRCQLSALTLHPSAKGIEAAVKAAAGSSRLRPGQSSVSLEQCLSEYTSEETLDEANAWYCSRCKKHQCAKKTVKFWSQCLPEVLVLVLKRYHSWGRMTRVGGTALLQ